MGFSFRVSSLISIDWVRLLLVISVDLPGGRPAVVLTKRAKPVFQQQHTHHKQCATNLKLEYAVIQGEHNKRRQSQRYPCSVTKSRMPSIFNFTALPTHHKGKDNPTMKTRTHRRKHNMADPSDNADPSKPPCLHRMKSNAA
jgi:hypothetical protein